MGNSSEHFYEKNEHDFHTVCFALGFVDLSVSSLTDLTYNIIIFYTSLSCVWEGKKEQWSVASKASPYRNIYGNPTVSYATSLFHNNDGFSKIDNYTITSVG